MATFETSLRIPAMIDQMRTAVDFVSDAAGQIGMGAEGVHQCQIAVEEIITNIIQHGYTESSSSSNVIDIHVTFDQETFVIAIADNAPQYDPTQRPDPDPTVPLDERKTGGWGVYFVKQYMDTVEYHWLDNRNQIILKKRLS